MEALAGRGLLKPPTAKSDRDALINAATITTMAKWTRRCGS